MTLHIRGHRLGIQDHTSGGPPLEVPDLGRSYRSVKARLPTAGLVNRFRDLYRSRSYEVTVSDPTPPNPRIVADPEVWRGLRTGSRAFVQALVDNRRGRILATSSRQRIWLMALAARAFPSAKVALLVGTRNGARQLAEAIRPLLSEPVELIRGEDPRGGLRIRVSTYQSLYWTRPDLTIFADDRDVLSVLGREALWAFDEQHIFGFAAGEHRLSPQCRIELEATLGTVIYEAPGPGGRRAPVLVLVVEAPPITTIHGADALKNKRREIWQHGGRNDLIVEVATAFAEEPSRDEGRTTMRVTILVEGAEHGRELRARLPEWPLLVGRPETRQSLGALPARAILTHTHAQAYACLETDVLVRADGDFGPLACPGFPPRRAGTTPDSTVLVDFDDRSAFSLRRSGARLKSYQGMGWQIRKV